MLSTRLSRALLATLAVATLASGSALVTSGVANASPRIDPGFSRGPARVDPGFNRDSGPKYTTVKKVSDFRLRPDCFWIDRPVIPALRIRRIRGSTATRSRFATDRHGVFIAKPGSEFGAGRRGAIYKMKGG